MENLEIIERENDITYQIPQVNFPAFEDYKRQAEAVSAYIRSLPVTQENIKAVKVELAKARKLTDRLNRSRIDIKKEILSQYTVFESQVKELCDIVGEADEELRDKVRQLEELERKCKMSEIEELWDKRVSQYDQITKYFPCALDLWFQPQFLNKSVSMKQIEDDMRDWLEECDNNIRVASKMGEDYLYEYTVTGNLAEAIELVQKREQWESELEDEDPEEEIPVQIFVVSGEKDIKLAEMLLKENNINYKKGN